MLRIVICCLGGGSSGYLTFHLRKELADLGLQDQVSFSFMAFGGLASRQDRFDIAMICPHQEYEIKAAPEKYHIPVYVIPMQMYGLMPARDLIEDAEDLLKVWETNPTNPVTFPDEPRSMTCGRTVSHRRAKKLPEAGASTTKSAQPQKGISRISRLIRRASKGSR